jgi:ABC-type polysaccharide/polyol phosphate transport system ATPase subunit
MPLIELEDVDLVYPVRENHGITFKEFILKGVFRKKYEERWKTIQALTSISCRISDGERVGIIGCNGAGKSTLLRTIGGIYPVTKGERKVEGAICSLFDINVGFEPAATGWENIRYRAYLQGDTPKSINKKIQSIAEFTELGKFLDLPVNCYSAGMNTRLAFAIATSSQPEILLIDEVFGAGDLSFQKKAEARMRDFMNKARIVIMVGHNLTFLVQFCSRILWLDHGKLLRDGPAQEVVAAYQGHVAQMLAAA